MKKLSGQTELQKNLRISQRTDEYTLVILHKNEKYYMITHPDLITIKSGLIDTAKNTN